MRKGVGPSFVASALALAWATGCLSHTYRIPRDELDRITALAPEERGAKVRVVQRFRSEEEPPRGPTRSVVVTGGAVVLVPVHRGTPARRSNSAASSAQTGTAWIVVGLGAAIALAATEGARYDGWVGLHPMHPVFLRMPDGYWASQTLGELDRNLVHQSVEAMVSRRDGPFHPLGRAPLNRVGGVYGFELGAAQLDPVRGESPWGPLGRLALGGFPTQRFGILASANLGWGSLDRRATFQGRVGLELQAFPFRAGKLHGGFYGQVGPAWAKRDLGTVTQTRVRAFGALGGLLQLELTTRLALTLRAGAALAFPESDPRIVPEFTLGFAVY